MSLWAAIFDMDGVIADTNPLHRESWREFCRSRGLSLSDEDMERRVFGRTNKDTLRDLFGADTPPERLAELAEAKESLFRRMAKGALAPLPGLADLIRDLKSAGALLAVATSAPPGNAAMTLAETGLAGTFPVVVDETMVDRGKPAPDVYLTAAAMLGVQPGRCVVFEDSLSGIRAARAAGMAVVGLATTHSLGEIAPLTDLSAGDFTPFTAEQIASLLDRT